MVIGDETSTIAFTVKEAVAAAKAGLADMPNAEVLDCDSKGDPNAAQACARDAVSKNVSAVIGSFGQLAQDASILTKAGIPYVGQTDLVGATSFNFNTGLASYTGMGVGFVKVAGCKKLGVLHLDGTDFLVDAIQKGAKSAGGDVVVRAPVASNAPDLTPAIAKLTGAGVDCVALSVTPPMVVQAVTAIAQSGAKVKFGGVNAIFPAAIIKALGDKANGAYTFDLEIAADDTTAPIVAKLQSAMAPFDSSAKVTTIGMISYAAAKMIGQAAKTVNGPVNAASLLTALNGITNFDSEGIFGSITNKEQTNPAFKRLMNTSAIVYQITGGKLVKQGDFFSIASAINS
jgi:ABC-type branched-subunit amino acid transport system substrate-binding protein